MQLITLHRKVFCIFLLVLLCASQGVSVSAESATWTSIGPEGGTILALAIDPSTPSTLYAGTGTGGVFKSTNSGGTWYPVNTDLGNFHVSGLLIDPLTPTTLYAVTWGDVYKSTNGGGNWSTMGIDMWYGYQELYNLTIDPITPTTLYSWINGLGIFKSTNGGGDWDEIVNDLDEDIGFLAVDPLTSTTLYVITDGGEVFTSTNSGEHWIALSTDLRSVGNIYVLVIDPITSTTLYVGTASGVYKSINGGINWSKVGTIGSTLALVIDPITPSTLYAGTQLYGGIGGIFKSTNSGGNWTQINTGINPPQTTVSSLAINPLTPSTLYAGLSPIYGRNDGGVFKSTNGGATWSASNTNLMNTDISAVAVDPATPTTLYAGSHAEGVYKSVNGGGSWNIINNGLPFLKVITSLAIDPLTPTTLYAGTGSNGIYKSTNGGGNWVEVNTGLDVTQFEYSISALAIDPTTPATLYAGTAGGVVKSTNGGGNWSAVNTGLTNTDVNALVIDPLTPAILYVGTFMGGVFRSTDSGGNWNPVNAGLTDDIVNTLAIDPVTPTTLYAGTWLGGIFKSIDSGGNWYPINTGLPLDPVFNDLYLEVNTLAIDPLTSSTIYAGLGWGPGSQTYPYLEGGVFKSTDGGGTWTTVGSGLTDLYINALAINPAAPADLYAATDGGGIAALNNTIITTYPLSVTREGAGTGTVNSSPTGIDCGSTCSYDFVYNTVVMLTATPTSPSTFGGWNGAGCSGTGTCSVTMSSAQSVTATFNPPGTSSPALIYPANGSTLLTNLPTFTWNTVNGATSYNIQVSTSSSFSLLKVNTTTTTPSYTPTTALTAKTLMYWRVRTNSPSGTSAWSPVWIFTTANPPPAPMLVSPATNTLVTTSTVRLDWNNVTMPAGTVFQKYEVQMATNSAFSANMTLTDAAISEYTFGPLTPNTLYYWRVRAYNTLGQYGAWSASRTFRAAILPPTLVTPLNADVLNNKRPTFVWNPVTGATGYTVEVSTVSTFSSKAVNATTTATSYTHTTDLTANKLYYWRVKANGPNGPSLYSEVRTFTTGNPPSVPTLSAPANNALVTTTSPLLNWNNSTLPAGTTFTRYEIQTATNNAFTTDLVTADVSGIANSQHTPPALMNGIAYYWRVRAVGQMGAIEQYSGWSLVRSVRIAYAGPTLLLPANGATGVALKPTFTWNATAGATSYNLQVSKYSTFSPLAINKTVTTPTYTHTLNLTAGTTYYWRVRINGPFGPGAWSLTFSFTTP